MENGSSSLGEWVFCNSGAGGHPRLFFAVSRDHPFYHSDLDANMTACVIERSNEVGKGNPGDRLLGKVVWLHGMPGDGGEVPAACGVQVWGVVRLRYTSPAPLVGGSVEVDGHGRVRHSRSGRGIVIALYIDRGECDVLLSDRGRDW